MIDPGNSNATINNYQIRYYLSGAAQNAYEMPNAKVRMISTDRPVLKEWVSFSLPVRRGFEALWGVVPKDYTSLRILFEARWDRKPKGTLLQADVYYDDLSVTGVTRPRSSYN